VSRDSPLSLAPSLPGSQQVRGAPFWRQLWLCHVRSLKQQHEKLGTSASMQPSF